MRPTTPIPNGCSFNLLSCRLNYVSPQRFLSPNRTTPQMYRSPDCKKISLKQARSPASRHESNNTFQSSRTSINTYFEDYTQISGFSQFSGLNRSNQLRTIFEQNKIQRRLSPIDKFGGLLGTEQQSIQIKKNRNKLSQIETDSFIEISNRNKINHKITHQNIQNILIQKQNQNKQITQKQLYLTSSKVPRISLTTVTTQQNKSNHQTLIYTTQLFPSQNKLMKTKYLSPGKQSEKQRLKEYGQFDLGQRQTYPSIGQMSSFIMDLSPRESKFCHNFYREKNRMASPQGHSKIICPQPTNFSKKTDLSFIEKANCINNPCGNPNEYNGKSM